MKDSGIFGIAAVVLAVVAAALVVSQQLGIIAAAASVLFVALGFLVSAFLAARKERQP